MKLSIAAVIAVTLLVASHRAARADDAETIGIAQDWWQALVRNDGTLAAPTKKAPLQYGVFPYAGDSCGAFEKKRVDKVTSAKGFEPLAKCLLEALAGEGGKPELTWEPSDVDSLEIGFDYDRKLLKKVRKAARKLTIVSLEIAGTDTGDNAAVHVFFGVDKKGAVKGVFMYVDSAN